MSVLDKVRRWIDGDSAETVLEQAAKDAQIKPRSASEEFIVKLARAVEEVMQNEMVPLPQGTVIIPTEYIIFLSEADDKDWHGIKRKGLEQGLFHVLSERAKEISGKKKLETQSFAVELRVDGTLEKGDVRVQHGWDETSSSQKTGVIARGKAQLPSQQQKETVAPVQRMPQISPLPQNEETAMMPNHPLNHANQAPPATIPQFQYQAPQAQPADDPDEATRVNTRKSELYKLEIWRNGIRQNVVPVYQNQIAIGRGSKSKSVDIALLNDPEISRLHATLICDANGFSLISEGRNATMVSNREIAPGQRIQLSAGEPIAICSYLLRIQPR